MNLMFLIFCFQVLLAQCSIHSEKCDKTCAEVEIDEHIECGCECKIKRHHCNAKQVCAMSCLVQCTNDACKSIAPAVSRMITITESKILLSDRLLVRYILAVTNTSVVL